VLEIDVDIGRLVAVGRDKAREQQVVVQRIDRGDAEQEADDRVRRRAAALA
jgi:hypothetical protein